MGARMMNRTKCPMCGQDAFFPSLSKKPHPNLEYVQTKRGVRQYFHRDCYDKMIREHKVWVS